MTFYVVENDNEENYFIEKIVFEKTIKCILNTMLDKMMYEYELHINGKKIDIIITFNMPNNNSFTGIISSIRKSIVENLQRLTNKKPNNLQIVIKKGGSDE